ncbi:MAG: RNA-binding protein [Nitrospirae bacterium]|nr:MAG: RNA-binding protein [Nitrospirota bacterium]
MAERIYVGGLSDLVTDKQLGELCAPHGTVKSALVITDQWTGKSRGYGFVEMGSAEESQNVVAALNAILLEGQRLRCFLA